MTDLNTYIRTERGNRFAAAKIKKDETFRVFLACRERQLGGELGKHDFDFTWYVKNRKKDPDNLVFAQKFVFDGLVAAGVIHCDGQECVGKLSHAVMVDAVPRVEVTIT